MNAREAMRLLLEGKTLERDDPWYLMKLDENGTLVSCDSKNLLYGGSYAFRDCHTMIGDFDRIYEMEVHRPCPFCGSTDIREVYFDDEGNELEEWMMTDANRECESEGLTGFESWEEFVEASAYHFIVKCGGCNAQVISEMNIKDAWAKWNWRTI